jgi:hypothetical protein
VDVDDFLLLDLLNTNLIFFLDKHLIKVHYEMKNILHVYDFDDLNKYIEVLFYLDLLQQEIP